MTLKARLQSRRGFVATGAALSSSALFGSVQHAFAQGTDTIKIGAARAMTGLVASSFAPLYVGVKIAAEEINAAGGILGRKIEVIEADDESSPAKEPAVMRKLIDSGAQAMLGPVGSSHSLSALPTTTAAKMIHACGGWAEELADGVKYPYHYQFTYNTGHQGEAVVRHTVDKLGIKKIGILQENTGFGESAAAATLRAMKKRGLEPVAHEVYPLTAPDLKVYAGKLRAAGAEALLLWNSPVQGMILTCAALQSMKWYPPLLGGTSLYSNVVLETTDPEVLKNAFGTLITTMTFTATESPGARQQAYAKRIVTFPETKTWEIPAAITPFYDFMHMLTMVVNAEKKFDADLIKKAFDATKNYDGMIGRISFTPQNHCALDGDQMVMVSLLSGKSPKAMGCFRERA